MHSQDMVAPGPDLAGGMDGDVFVIGPEWIANGSMRIVPINLIPIAGINPEGQGGGQGLIEGRLVAFVAPMKLGFAGLLHRQATRIGHVFDDRVVA